MLKISKFLRKREIVIFGTSMEPSFVTGSRARLDRLAFVFRAPRRGEVVALRSSEENGRIDLKRVIGLPHERLEWLGGRFYVDGKILDESYARIASEPPGDDEVGSSHLGSNEYFVAGDNRLYSRDCRHYGPVNRRVFLGLVYNPEKNCSADLISVKEV